MIDKKTMFENIRDRIKHVQHDLSLSFRDFSISISNNGESSSDSLPKNTNNKFSNNQFRYDLDVNLYTGADVVEYFQHRWAEIQTQTKQNAQRSQTVQNHIKDINSYIENLNKVSQKLDSDLDSLTPEIENSLIEIESELTRSLTLLDKLHEAITQLKQETIDTSFKKRKNESKKKLNEMVIRRAEDLALYESQLYSKHERKENETLRERQLVFQQAFEEELKFYKEKGHILELEKPSKINEESKLEEISLDIGEDEVNELEKFLDD